MTAEQFFTRSIGGKHEQIAYEFDDAQREPIFTFAEAYALFQLQAFSKEVIKWEIERQKLREALQEMVLHYHLMHPNRGITIGKLEDCEYRLCREMSKLLNLSQKDNCTDSISRSEQRRVAIQKGEVMPTFEGKG